MTQTLNNLWVYPADWLGFFQKNYRHFFLSKMGFIFKITCGAASTDNIAVRLRFSLRGLHGVRYCRAVAMKAIGPF